MPDVISVLPDAIANQIAAGEVIQRPASVVKELLENAVDAGADTVDLIIKDAGRVLVQVIDNGKGMSPMDARLCWERHATSKIKKTEDLFAIRSFGFRGEALASIAAVAQVEMRTRQIKDETGSVIIIEASDVKKQEPCVQAPGTIISVKNLFYNIPARRNFLKSNSVEMKHIIDEFVRVALPNPDVRFTLTHNDNKLYDLQPGSQKARIADLLGLDEKNLLEAEEASGVATFRVFPALPTEARKTRGDQFFIVNGRFIKEPYLHHAMMSVYSDYLPSDHFPVYVVFMDMDPAKIDINVHPTKTEIKFEDERSLYVLLRSVVKKALAQQHLNTGPANGFDNDSFASFLNGSRPEFPEEPKINVNKSYNPFGPASYPKPNNSNLHKWKELYEGMERQEKPDMHSDLLFEEILSENKEKKIRVEYFNNSQVMQLFNRYIVVKTGTELLIADQELAHRRVLFARYMENLALAQSTSQQLLFPRVIEFGQADAQLVEDLLDELKRIGFDISVFGKQAFIINGLPAEAEKAEAKSLLEGLIEEYKNTANIDKSDRQAKLALALAKQSSVRKGHKLGESEMTHLMNDLMNCKDAAVTPDGKPVFVRFNEEMLEKLFL